MDSAESAKLKNIRWSGKKTKTHRHTICICKKCSIVYGLRNKNWFSVRAWQRFACNCYSRYKSMEIKPTTYKYTHTLERVEHTPSPPPSTDQRLCLLHTRTHAHNIFWAVLCWCLRGWLAAYSGTVYTHAWQHRHTLFLYRRPSRSVVVRDEQKNWNPHKSIHSGISCIGICKPLRLDSKAEFNKERLEGEREWERTKTNNSKAVHVSFIRLFRSFNLFCLGFVCYFVHPLCVPRWSLG